MPLAKTVRFCYAILVVITIVIHAHQLLRSHITLHDAGMFVLAAVF